MADNEVAIIPQDIPCPYCEEGKIEMSTKVYFDVQGSMRPETDDSDPVALIAAIRFSHLNDTLFGMPFNMEGELFIGCDNCGAQFNHEFSDELEAGVMMNSEIWQNGEFYVGDTIPAAQTAEEERAELEADLVKLPSGGTLVHDTFEIERDGDAWTIWEEGEHYHYKDINGVLDHVLGELT